MGHCEPVGTGQINPAITIGIASFPTNHLGKAGKGLRRLFQGSSHEIRDFLGIISSWANCIIYLLKLKFI